MCGDSTSESGGNLSKLFERGQGYPAPRRLFLLPLRVPLLDVEVEAGRSLHQVCTYPDRTADSGALSEGRAWPKLSTTFADICCGRPCLQISEATTIPTPNAANDPSTMNHKGGYGLVTMCFISTSCAGWRVAAEDCPGIRALAPAGRIVVIPCFKPWLTSHQLIG